MAAAVAVAVAVAETAAVAVAVAAAVVVAVAVAVAVAVEVCRYGTVPQSPPHHYEYSLYQDSDHDPRRSTTHAARNFRDLDTTHDARRGVPPRAPLVNISIYFPLCVSSFIQSTVGPDMTKSRLLVQFRTLDNGTLSFVEGCRKNNIFMYFLFFVGYLWF